MKVTFILVLLFNIQLFGQENNFEKEKQIILGGTGCYEVNYFFKEVEALDTEYTVSDKIYDLKGVYEYIFPIEQGNSIQLQHILFVKDDNGELAFVMKHTGDRWIYEPSFYYGFIGAGQWNTHLLTTSKGQWLRSIIDLDDGPRYSCVTNWDHSKSPAEFNCESYAPIPGREYRDMKRADYQELARYTRLVADPNGWTDFQNNIKIVREGEKTKKLVREEGYNKYIKAEDQNYCNEAKNWAAQRVEFWKLTQEVWDETLNGKNDFTFAEQIDGVPRFSWFTKLENKYFEKIKDKQIRDQVKSELKTIIEKYTK